MPPSCASAFAARSPISTRKSLTSSRLRELLVSNSGTCRFPQLTGQRPRPCLALTQKYLERNSHAQKDRGCSGGDHGSLQRDRTRDRAGICPSQRPPGAGRAQRIQPRKNRPALPESRRTRSAGLPTDTTEEDEV